MFAIKNKKDSANVKLLAVLSCLKNTRFDSIGDTHFCQVTETKIRSLRLVPRIKLVCIEEISSRDLSLQIVLVPSCVLIVR